MKRAYMDMRPCFLRDTIIGHKVDIDPEAAENYFSYDPTI